MASDNRSKRGRSRTLFSVNLDGFRRGADARRRERSEDYNLFHKETKIFLKSPYFQGVAHAYVYSIGSNNKFDFESALLDNVSKNCEIHVFDHTVSSLRLVSKQRKPWRVHFHQIDLAATTSDKGDFKSLSDMVRDLGHVGRTIDILKVDCEGCEWTTFASWFDAPLTISQILVEVHQGTIVSKDGSSDDDEARKFPPAKRFFQRLHDENFAIFHKEANIQWTAFENLCLEFSLVRLPRVYE